MNSLRPLSSPWLVVAGIFFVCDTAHAGDRWVTLENCHYVANAANDGDSFHVRAGNREFIFRLYFVDAPETDRSVPKRVVEQAKYFDVSTSQALQIGLEAEQFTREKLARPFGVRTCKQDARGRSRRKRYFAFVQTETGDLGEQLVANGLARVYGAASETPDLNTPELEWRKLEELERKARQQKIGGWGIESGRLKTRAANQPVTNADSFNLLRRPKARPPTGTASARAAEVAAKLDINSATVETLEGIPGIGPILALRIIAARPFKTADELGRVKGIGKIKYLQARPYFE